MSLEDFKNDLTRRISNNLIPTIPSYTNNMKLKKKIEITYRMLRRASILRDRILMMINAFYLGQLLEKETFSRSEEHTSELQSQSNLVCRLLLEKKKIK